MNLKRLVLIVLLLFGASLVVWGGVAAAQEDETPVETAFLGIRFEETDDGTALVTNVVIRSPARDAGLLRGDVITAINGDPVTAANLAETVQSFSPGDTITLTVVRGEDTLELEATLGTRVEMEVGRGIQIMPDLIRRPYLGVTLIAENGTVTINTVEAGSPAEEAGLQVGDVIAAVDDSVVTTTSDVVRAISSASPGDSITLSITRDGEPQSVEITLAERPAVNAMLDIRPGGMGLGLSGDVTLSYSDGALVIESISDDSPLAQAGLQAGDRIVAVNGTALSGENFPMPPRDFLSGDALVLTVERGEETIEIEIPTSDLLWIFSGPHGVRGELPFNPEALGPMMEQFGLPMFSGRGYLGVRYVTLNEDEAAANEVDVTDGGLIMEVAENSPAAAAGLQVGDIVTAVNGEAVDEARTLAERIFAYDPGNTITLDIIRDGETVQVEVTLGESVGAGMRGLNIMPLFRGMRGMEEMPGMFEFHFPDMGRGGRIPCSGTAPDVVPSDPANDA